MIAAMGTLATFILLQGMFLVMPQRWIVPYYRSCAGGWAEGAAHDCVNPPVFLPQQPINTWTNLAYVFAGWMTGDPWFAALMTGLGICSALYHGTSTSWAGKLDVTAIYVTFPFLMLSVAYPTWVALAVAVPVGVVAGQVFYRNLTVPVGTGFALTLAVLVFSEPSWLLAAGTALFGLGYIAWNLDKRGRILGVSGHGAWHQLTAAGYVCLFVAGRP